MALPSAILISYGEAEERTLPKKYFRFGDPANLDFLVDVLHNMHKGMDNALGRRSSLLRDVVDGTKFSFCYGGSRIVNTILSIYTKFSFDPLLDSHFCVMKSDGALYEVRNYLIHHQEMKKIPKGYDYTIQRYILPNNERGHNFANNVTSN